MYPEETDLPAEAILKLPHFNKGTAFTQQERDELNLNGLLPAQVSTIEQQLQRRYNNFKGMRRELTKINFLSDLQKRNEVLFYRFCLEHCEEVLPYLYTPYIGEISLDYSNLYSQNRGLFLNYLQKDRIEQIVQNYPHEVSAIVVTDGSRILGLGDVGVGGMSIPNGKLTLYSLFGGIHPRRTLPIVLDLGTNNETLLNDPLYIGLKSTRISESEYYDFVERFICAIKKRWPRVLLQWEDFQKPHAQNLLQLYQNQICSFNDDIQGTASVALAALLSALKVAQLDLKKQNFCIVGAGGAGTGIANLMVQKLMQEGVDEKTARSQFYLIDQQGLIHLDLQGLDEHQKKFAHTPEALKNWKVKDKQNISLYETIEHAKPTVLIGVSGQKGVFTQDVVQLMARQSPLPIIFPLSNPTDYAEATPKDLFEWTQGKCIVATGSPFEPVTYLEQQYHITQCNNVYIFPGVGLGIIASRAKKVTNEMFIKAAEILAEASPADQYCNEGLFPKIKDLREISQKMGLSIAELAHKRGLDQLPKGLSVHEAVEKEIWYPTYVPLTRKK